MGQTRTEKIIQRYAVGLEADQMIRSGQTVWLQPDHVLTHDNTAAVIPKFNDLGLMHIYNPNQPVIALDHNIQDRTKKNLSKYELIQSFAETKGLTFFLQDAVLGIKLWWRKDSLLLEIFVWLPIVMQICMEV